MCALILYMEVTSIYAFKALLKMQFLLNISIKCINFTSALLQT